MARRRSVGCSFFTMGNTIFISRFHVNLRHPRLHRYSKGLLNPSEIR